MHSCIVAHLAYLLYYLINTVIGVESFPLIALLAVLVWRVVQDGCGVESLGWLVGLILV